MNRRMLLESLLSASRLPAEFQEVEYIESSGTQYIDSGFALTDTTKSICDIAFTNINTTQLNGLYVDSSNRFQIGILNGQFYIGLGTKSQYFNLTLDQNKHTFVNNSATKTCSIDNESYTDTTMQTKSSTSHLVLFARLNAQSSTIDLYCYQKLYSCQIYDNNTLARDFVPCYRKADNVIGLYDLVNGVFYTNAGTGSFTKGGNV